MHINRIYTNTARFDGTARALTDDEMRKIAPSIFATEAHESRSDRFAAIPTIDVLRGLMNEGFSPVGVKQSRTRVPGKAEFTKHLIRLRRLDDDAKYRVGDSVAEILLKNANDGTSAYDLTAGLFRIVCLNSLVAQSETFDAVKVRHTGDALGQVIEGTYRVLDTAQRALAAPAEWSRIKMDRDARQAFAEAAHIVRFGDAEGNVDTPIQPQALLQARRQEDLSSDLWTTLNVVQENMIRGGLTARQPARVNARGQRERGRRVTTREVNGIDQDLKLNKALWTLGERMASLLRQAA